MVEGKVIGTMDFFATETLDLSQERMDALRSVGRLVSVRISRLKAEIQAARTLGMVENIP